MPYMNQGLVEEEKLKEHQGIPNNRKMGTKIVTKS